MFPSTCALWMKHHSKSICRSSSCSPLPFHGRGLIQDDHTLSMHGLMSTEILSDKAFTLLRVFFRVVHSNELRFAGDKKMKLLQNRSAPQRGLVHVFRRPWIPTVSARRYWRSGYVLRQTSVHRQPEAIHNSALKVHNCWVFVSCGDQSRLGFSNQSSSRQSWLAAFKPADSFIADMRSL